MKSIQIAVAMADIIICGIGQALILIAGWVLFAVLLLYWRKKCRYRH